MLSFARSFYLYAYFISSDLLYLLINMQYFSRCTLCVASYSYSRGVLVRTIVIYRGNWNVNLRTTLSQSAILASARPSRLINADNSAM